MTDTAKPDAPGLEAQIQYVRLRMPDMSARMACAILSSLQRLQQLEREPSLERSDGKVVVDDAGNISRSTRDVMFAPLSLSPAVTPDVPRDGRMVKL